MNAIDFYNLKGTWVAMAKLSELSASGLREELAALKKKYEALKAQGLKLDLSRGKPDGEQLDLSRPMLDSVNSKSDLIAADGSDCRNYGAPAGIPEARALMAEMLELKPEEVFVGGNSSLNLMHDCLGIAYLHGTPKSKTPWCKLPKVKFLCPSPGYDRHFSVTEHFGVEMITVPMTPQGPDMDVVEELVASDSAIKGMWCIPKYSNPTGMTYSDTTVRRLAAMSPAAPDFLIFWDNAYAAHHLHPDSPDKLLGLVAELKKTGKAGMGLMFTSTSKVTFAGAGIAAMGASKENLDYFMKHWGLQTIGFDKLNQLRHARFFSDGYTIERHMRRHAELLRPKFEAVQEVFNRELGGLDIAWWTDPRGGYFISLDTLDGCAKRTLALCAEAGVVMTPAGATFPYGVDPRDRNIRVAPTFATLEEVRAAAELVCLCAKLAGVEKLLGGASEPRAS